MYVATRKFAPFLRLCTAMSDETGAVADTTIHSEEHDVEVPLTMVVRKFVARLLEDGVEGDPLMKKYGVFLVAQEWIPEGLREDLVRIFED